MIDKKKAFLLTIALFVTLMIGVIALFPHSKKDMLTSIDSISMQEVEAWEKKAAEVIVKAIKCYANVDDVTISVGTNPQQVNIFTNCLRPEAKEHIEKLISCVYPEATVNYSSD